ncbi:hypothetical protein [Pyxidicoccus trucidator]|uniref:hypothetical protein n=1 Tax=Pyxidicoccus trucidator TaxID=2709662 RepID=UPI0013DA225E|nr:hypothetical protein [Pyxidicoccus trucidator]
MGKFRAMACILALGSALAYSGCSDDLDDKPGAGPFPTPIPDAGVAPDAGTDAGTEFTGFVKDLIENQTTAAGTPVEVENRNFVDTEPTDAFPETFFQ